MDIAYLISLQEIRQAVPGFINQIFITLSNLMEGIFPMLLAGIMYWSVDKKYGIYMFVNYAGGLHINQFIKGSACVSRPWIKDSRVMPYEYVENYSFPSDHASVATSTYGTIGLWARKHRMWLTVACLFLIFLTSYSRNWLCMHTPQDVVAGICITLLWMYLANRILLWIEDNPKQDLLVATLGCALTILITEFLVYKSYPVMQATYGKLVPNGPEGAGDTMYTCGFCLGILVGWILERRFVKFDCAGTVKERLIRAVVGVLVTVVVAFAANNYLWLLIPDNAAHLGTTFLISLTVTFLYPFMVKCVKKSSVKSHR